jgi:dTDP-4-dehydrorhamnose 3,5-epimerase-like enzyme
MKSIGIKRYKFQCIVEKEEQGILKVFESNDLPFSVERVFTIVNAFAGSQRGKHAHKKCNQLLCCVAGEVHLICKDGNKQIEILLNSENDAILIPSGIWAEQKYLKDNSVLMVFCDRPYEESDYIRNFQLYLDWKKKQI